MIQFDLLKRVETIYINEIYHCLNERTLTPIDIQDSVGIQNDQKFISTLILMLIDNYCADVLAKEMRKQEIFLCTEKCAIINFFFSKLI